MTEPLDLDAIAKRAEVADLSTFHSATWADVLGLVAELREARDRGGCEHRILVCGACLTRYCDGCRSYQCPHEFKSGALLEVKDG